MELRLALPGNQVRDYAGSSLDLGHDNIRTEHDIDPPKSCEVIQVLAEQPDADHWNRTIASLRLDSEGSMRCRSPEERDDDASPCRAACSTSPLEPTRSQSSLHRPARSHPCIPTERADLKG